MAGAPTPSDQRIGEYDVVCALAIGGMAEILLARARGPAGFERLVVIKRILPHMASERAFRDMFLDEARIVARIRHPNVVPVHKLGEEDGSLYLVMDYVHGETLGSVIRRLSRDDAVMPPALAAHIIAEAAAGLHAAHELTWPDGRPAELVHRDIAPANLLVGFQGTVQLLDFGIARSRDRITKTEAGLLKGRYAYMAPEQSRGEPLDRRADIFSLGVVLFELSTGRRLFKRANPILSMKAVNEASVPDPARLVDGYPSALSAVLYRALAREREDRFATAAEMRDALISAQRTIAPRMVGDVELTALMRARMPERLAEKEQFLTAVRAGEVTSATVPRAEIDEDVEPETVALPDEAASRSRGRRGGWVFAALAVAGLAAALGAYAWSGETGAPPPTSAASPRAEPETAEEPPTEPEPAVHLLTLRSEPPGATVEVQGIADPLTTPTVIELADSPDPVRLRYRMEGYTPAERVVRVRGDRELSLRLEPSAPTAPPGARRRRARRRRAAAAAEPGDAPADDTRSFEMW